MKRTRNLIRARLVLPPPSVLSVFAVALALAISSCGTVPGEPCESDQDCSANQYCDSTLNACANDKSEAEYCDRDSECESALQCLSFSCRVGTEDSACILDDDCLDKLHCVDRKCTVGTPGSPCDYNSQCDPGLHCSAQECASGEVDSPCDYDAQCDSTLVCRGEFDSLTCRAPVGLGERCRVDADCDNADRGVVCVAAYNPAVCAKPGPLGKPCAENADCNEGLVCAGEQIGLLTCQPEPSP